MSGPARETRRSGSERGNRAIGAADRWTVCLAHRGPRQTPRAQLARVAWHVQASRALDAARFAASPRAARACEQHAQVPAQQTRAAAALQPGGRTAAPRRQCPPRVIPTPPRCCCSSFEQLSPTPCSVIVARRARHAWACLESGRHAAPAPTSSFREDQQPSKAASIRNRCGGLPAASNPQAHCFCLSQVAPGKNLAGRKLASKGTGTGSTLQG